MLASSSRLLTGLLGTTVLVIAFSRRDVAGKKKAGCRGGSDLPVKSKAQPGPETAGHAHRASFPICQPPKIT